MSYSSISKCVNDASFRARINACCAKEGSITPETVTPFVIWPVASKSDIEAAYESALAADNPDPGGDSSVITDEMILSAVQASMPPLP